MQKLIEIINNTMKLITSLVTLAILGGFAFGGLWVYRNVAEMTSKPIKLPSVELPKVEIAAPDIKLPSISFGEEPTDTTGEFAWPVERPVWDFGK